ncbi:serine/threonine-protein kinase [Acidipropionibacterium virtanenii]|uniref:non-specific serine/threonine protein kinase n=1 Tax=Acidipropionibacterium virtanenii TaxID=2057246 RepID=A0A344UQ55_9ACTN|nr:serine/threonine-protein kinase [Acidipropionibacterium virtanenii]AXE37403.1 Serine/threonine-protein kinase PknA [Acidipropionibacterium virtanenii]
MTAPGDRLGSRYEFDEVIGNGAMGQVWRAHDQQGGVVAVKMLHPHLATDSDIRRRFFDESQILTSITHPAVVRVRDVVMEGATLGIVMEYVEGPDLGSELKEHAGHNQRMQEDYAARLGAEIADGLAAIHAAKICHRDVKPANVLLTKAGPGPDDPEATRISAPGGGASTSGWHPKITDFGVSKILDSAASTSTAFAGTPNYVSPEIILGRPPTPASDLYSFGVMLYEMVAGRTPFAAPSREAVMHAHMAQAPARPDGLSDRMWQIISCCLAKDPAGRPVSAEILALELRRLADGQAPGELLTPSVGAPGASRAAAAAGTGVAATYIAGQGWDAMSPSQSPAPFQQSPGTLVGPYGSGQGVAGQGVPPAGQGGSAPSGGTFSSPGTVGGSGYPPGLYRTSPYPTAVGASYPGAYPEPQMPQPGPAAPMMAAPPAGGGQSAPPKKSGRRWLPLILAVVAVAIVLGVVFSPIGLGGKDDDASGGPSSASTQGSGETSSSDPTTPTAEPTTAVALPAGAKACSPTVAVGGKNTSCPFAENVAAAVPADHGDRFSVTAYSPATKKEYTLECTSGQYVLCTKAENNIEVYVIK